MDVLGFRAAGETERRELAAWLLDRALEHDRPSLLFELAADRLRAGRVVRPGVTQLERLVASVRAEATAETYRRLEGLLDTRRRETLDELLVDDPSLHRSRLSWLRQRAVAITPRAILGELEKLAYLRGLAVEYRFAVDQELNRRRLRPLRSPGAHQGPLTTPIGAGAG